MAKSDKTLSYVLYLFLFLSFLAGIYVCFSYGFKPKQSPAPAPAPAPLLINTPGPLIMATPSSNPVIVKKDTVISLNTMKASLQSPASAAQTPATDPKSCPTLLVRKGNQLFMYNQNAPEEPGVNPVIFNSLDDYIYYVKVQRYKYGNNCPVLYLQEESDAQGNDVYRVRPGPFDTQGGTQTIPGFPNGMVLPQIPVTYPSLPVNAMTPPNYMAQNLENMGGYSINPISSNNATMNTLTVQGQTVPPYGLPAVMPTPQANVTGSMPTTFPSNVQSNASFNTGFNTGTAPVVQYPNPNSGFYTGNAPMVSLMSTGPSAFNQSSTPTMTTPVPTLVNSVVSGAPSTITQYVDSSRKNPPFNEGGYAGFDPKNQYTGIFTNLDAVHNSTLFENPGNGLSDNPMDPNWGGVRFTRAQVNSGKYDDNIVTKPVYSGAPNVMMNPNSLVPLVKPIPNNPIIAQDTKIKKSSPENA